MDIPEAEILADSGNVLLGKRSPSIGPAFSVSRKDEWGAESQSQRNKKWERTTQDDFLEINEQFVPSFPQDEEVVGIITMEDVIEELLQVLLTF